jgi:hypothetical protein
MSLTVIIVSYNVKKLLEVAIDSVLRTYPDKNLQIIVVDNGSSDGSPDLVAKKFPRVKLIQSRENKGFSSGNNLARPFTKGEVILFLNPDTKVEGQAIKKCLDILTQNSRLGAVTCKVLLPNGKIDYSCHRGLPTVWNTFCYWTGLSKLFPKSGIFSGYNASFKAIDTSHEIDCASGTFLMIRKNILDDLNWWDEDYYWNGEDIEMFYRLRRAGWKVWYEASEHIVHYKGSSSGLWTTKAVDVPVSTQIRSAKSAAMAMRIFVTKHKKELGSAFTMAVVSLGIYLLEKYRLWKISAGKDYAK